MKRMGNYHKQGLNSSCAKAIGSKQPDSNPRRLVGRFSMIARSCDAHTVHLIGLN